MSPRRLTNRELRLASQFVFAHDQALQLATPFANRDDTRAQLHAVLKAKPTSTSRIYCVSDLKGSGKTFLLNSVLNEIGAADIRILMAGAELGKNLSPPTGRPFGHVVLVDEWDIKADAAKDWVPALQAIGEFCRRHAVLAILLGDYTLRSLAVREQLAAAAPTTLITLEPLSRDFFLEALQTRLKDRFPNDPIADFVDPAILDALFPEAGVSAATFRTTFKTFYELASKLAVNDEDAWIGHEAAEKLLDSKVVASESTIDAALRIASHIRNASNRFQPMTFQQLQEICQLPDGQVQSVMESLCRAQYLVSIGVPVLGADGAYNRNPEPFVPSVLLLLTNYLEATRAR